MKPLASPLAKLICGVLFTDDILLVKAKECVLKKYGVGDFESHSFKFDVSYYYKTEMGWPNYRRFWSFEKLINPKAIGSSKIECNKIEDELAVSGNRKINLDPGYLDYDKIVLASAKYNWQKIYLNNGIYADLTLRYEKGKYGPFPWSFPDFKEGDYNSVLLKIREIYKLQMKTK